MSVELRRSQAEIANMSSASRQGARLMHWASRNPYATSAAGPPSVITSAIGSSCASFPSVAPPGFDESVSRMRAEALYVSSVPAPSNIIPCDLLDVEPMPVGNAHYDIPFWDYYVFKNWVNVDLILACKYCVRVLYSCYRAMILYMSDVNVIYSPCLSV